MEEKALSSLAYITVGIVIPLSMYAIKGIITVIISGRNEKRRLDLRKKELEYTERLKRENSLSEYKKKILFAWQDLYTGNILSDLDANIESPEYGDSAGISDICTFHLGNFSKVIETERYDFGYPENAKAKVGYGFGYSQLIAYTLIHSNTVVIHKLIYMLNFNTGDDEIKSPYRYSENINTIAIHNLIYYYLKIEWLGNDMDELPVDSLMRSSRKIRKKYDEKEILEEINKIKRSISKTKNLMEVVKCYIFK